MLFSYQELKKIANLPQEVTPEEMTKVITSIGFEVEDISKFTNVKGIKFGKIKKVSKNPNGEKLFVCEIEFNDKNRVIQTTADNVEEGMVVIAFVPGSKVGNVTFDSKELKGVVSEGMLSAPSEFGIDKELCREDVISGIARYDEVTDLSIDPIEYLGLDDYIIEVDVLSNRSDANSYYVMAMELAAKFNTKPIIPQINKGKMNNNLKVSGDEIVALEAKNDFTITIKEQIFLNKHEIKSINNAADITNLTLLYSGQPTHAYDGDKVGNNFKVDDFSGEVIILGNKKIKLIKDQVVMIDDKVSSIASIIGLEDSSTSSSTKNLKLEMGIFNNAKVRRGVKAVKLNSKSSSQGSKKLAKGTTELGLRYLTNKLENFSNATNLKIKEKTKFKFDLDFIDNLAGDKISTTQEFKKVISALEVLGFEFNSEEVIVPSYRHDVEIMSDMAEEIFRFYGYNNFKPSPPNLAQTIIHPVKNIIVRIIPQGYQEIRAYTLSSEEQNIFNPLNFKEVIKLETYVSKQREIVRSSQIISLQEIALYNQKRGMKSWSFVSEGMIGNGKMSLGLISNVKTFDEIKKDIMNLLPNAIFKRLKNDMLHPGVSAEIIINNKVVGWLGKVHPKYALVDAYIAEILTEAFNKKDVDFKEYDETPLKFEDITISLKTKEDLAKHLEQYKGAYSVSVIDEYQDNDILKVTIRIVK